MWAKYNQRAAGANHNRPRGAPQHPVWARHQRHQLDTDSASHRHQVRAA